MMAVHNVEKHMNREIATRHHVDFGDVSRPASDVSIQNNPFSRETFAAPTPSKITELCQQAESLGCNIITLWEQLKIFVESREAVIRKRWLKKSKSDRSNIILQTWPGEMPRKHRPDFAALSDPAAQYPSRESYISCFKYPYFNHEDLVGAHPLPLLINSRGRNHPGVFAQRDREHMHVGIAHGVITQLRERQHLVLLSPLTRTHSYGKVISREGSVFRTLCVEESNKFSLGDGLLILEVQRTITEFLVRFCVRLLADKFGPGSKSLQLRPVPEPPALISTEASYTQKAIINAQAPYCRPHPHIHLAKMRSVVDAELNAIEDHIWALREDPAYFSALATEIYLANKIKMAFLPGQFSESSAYRTALTSVYRSSATEWIAWKGLQDRVRDMQLVLDEATLDMPETRLLQIFDRIVRLTQYVNHYLTLAFGEFQEYVVGSPELRPYILIETKQTHKTKTWSIRMKPTHGTGSLIHLIGVMLDDAKRWRYGGLNLIHELQQLIDHDKTERNKLSSLAIAKLSELAIWAEVRDWLMTDCAMDFDLIRLEREWMPQSLDAQPSMLIAGAIAKTEPPRSLLLLPDGLFLKENLHFPIHKARSESTVHALRETEAKLDEYWSIVDQAFARYPGHNGLISVLVEMGFSFRRIKRTPIYRNSGEVRSRDALPSTNRLSSTFSSMHIGVSNMVEKPSRPVLTQPKHKTKTRPDSNSATETLPASLDINKNKDSPLQNTLHVSKRALKVFRTMFHIPISDNQQSQPGEIPWSDFLHAMTSVGFSAEKLHGSAWRFVPKTTTWTASHPIHFHEPHPSSKISFTAARGFGRRLARHYDWCGEMFQLRSSKGIENEKCDTEIEKEASTTKVA